MWRSETLLKTLTALKFRGNSNKIKKAYVISRPDRLSNAKLCFLQRCGLDVTRLDPVYTDKTLNGMSRREYGCYLAHRNAWQHIIDGEDDSAVILEEDFEPVVNAERVRQHIDEHANIDLVRLGGCGGYCLTAYILSKRAAKDFAAQAVNVTDTMMLNYKNQVRIQHPNDSRYYGDGIFQQDRTNQDDTAIHDKYNRLRL